MPKQEPPSATILRCVRHWEKDILRPIEAGRYDENAHFTGGCPACARWYTGDCGDCPLNLHDRRVTGHCCDNLWAEFHWEPTADNARKVIAFLKKTAERLRKEEAAESMAEWRCVPTAGHETHGQSAIRDDVSGRDIAIVYDGKAHGAILAASPKLLAALEQIVKAADDSDNPKASDLVGAIDWRAARTAIREARGED